jgi:hypothetical protein
MPPVFAQFLEASAWRTPAHNGDEMMAWENLPPERANDLAKLPAKPIANHSTSNLPRGDQTETEFAELRYGKNAEHAVTPSVAAALGPEGCKVLRLLEVET